MQVEEGQKYLQKQFNVTARIGYQIDSFGHSALTPALFAELGYDALVRSLFT